MYVKENAEENVNENVIKVRRKLRSLIRARLHRHGGSDRQTSLHLYRCYVLLLLTYGMELFSPKIQKKEYAPDSSVNILLEVCQYKLN